MSSKNALAQEILGTKLKEIFGTPMAEVQSYGAGLDAADRKTTILKITFASETAKAKAERSLPKSIENLPLKLYVGPIAQAD